MKTVSFRFDIDTLTCILVVPKLIEISKNIILSSLFLLILGNQLIEKNSTEKKNKSHNNATIKLSTLTSSKLGLHNSVVDAKLRKYKNQINILDNSNSEIFMDFKNLQHGNYFAHKFNFLLTLD